MNLSSQPTVSARRPKFHLHLVSEQNCHDSAARQPRIFCGQYSLWAVDDICPERLLFSFKHGVEEILATNSTQSASLQGSSSTLAKKRLEEALTRLESVLDEKGSKAAAIQNLEESLADANKKISVLQDKNATIARRLDGAIERMKTLLGDQ